MWYSIRRVGTEALSLGSWLGWDKDSIGAPDSSGVDKELSRRAVLHERPVGIAIAACVYIYIYYTTTQVARVLAVPI